MARGRNSFRNFFAAAIFIALAAGAAAKAQPLAEAFPAPHWKSGKTPAGLWVDCVAESCNPPAHAIYVLEPADPDMAKRIRSGTINREWAEKLAASFRRSQGDEVTVLEFTVQTGQVPGWWMLYRCHCEGQTSFVSSQIRLASKGMMTFYSMAVTPEAAQENMHKLMAVVLGAASR